MKGKTAPAGPDDTCRLMLASEEIDCACWHGGHDSSVEPSMALRRSAFLLLHEGLGSISMWGRFPAKLAAASGRTVIAYSRPGYGQSSPARAPRQVDYLHQEAWQVLPQVVAALHDKHWLGAQRPMLVGHSDGASIALLFAARYGEQIAGVVAMAPHLWVEAESLAGIRQAGLRWQSSDFPGRLARHHDHPERVFYDWHDTWLGDDFAGWNIETEVAQIAVPVLAIQGEQDEYATMRQIERIAELAWRAEVTLCRLEDCGHSPQNDQPLAVIDAIEDFAARS